MAAAKSDEFDAYVLADTLRHQHAQWRPLTAPAPLLAELTAVTRDRQRILDMQVDTENRLRSVLEAYHPAPLHLFSSLDRDISSASCSVNALAANALPATLALIRTYPTPGAGRQDHRRADGRVHRPTRLQRPPETRGTSRAHSAAPTVGQ
ncbi:IS110 family transposase [Mycobacterium dioxanotrophicus]|uniref:IS110 family transposase n=1 Tax=Mycobacterium dioxanotrophicus TaxID=482462 RepID=UPI0022B75B4F|nr:transposase [Mycobacterium dioxanotrophicus]